MSEKLYVVLMAEDNKHDIVAAKRAWRQHHIRNPLHIVKDGEECLDYLLQRGQYSDPETAPPAGILLLDVNMPGFKGDKVADLLLKSDQGKSVKIVLFSALDEYALRQKAQEVGAAGYISKTFDEKLLKVRVRRYLR